MTPARHPSPRSVLVAAVAVLCAAAAGIVAFVLTRGAAAARPLGTGVVVIDTSLGYQRAQAAGTGMVLTSSGEVLTNNHVIAGATSIRVVLPGTGRSYAATVLGYDVSRDTALLRLKGASNLATVALGDSSRLVRGQAVRAVGNAGGTGRLAAARGTVTGLGRAITASDGQGASERLTGLIETDADVRPGDSGGPLLDASGRVVGMDTAASVSGGFSLQSATTDAYAIPIDRALAVVRLIEKGTSTATVHVGATAFLGVEVTSPGRGFGYGSGSTAGALVAGVVPGSPADRAGLAYGDRIVAVDGTTTASPAKVVALLLRRHPGERVTLAWLDPFGARRSATVALAAGPAQ